MMKNTAQSVKTKNLLCKMLCASVCLSALSSTSFAETIFWQTPKDQQDEAREYNNDAYQEDPLGHILQNEILTTPDMLESISLYSSETQSVSLTDLPFETRFKLSKMAVEQRNWGKAEELLKTLEETGEYPWTVWAKALMQSQKGQFSDAYTTLSYFTPRFESPFYDVAQELSIDLALRLAEESQSNSNYPLAGAWLKRINTELLTRENTIYYNRLVRKQNKVYAGEVAQQGYQRPLRVSILLPLSGPLQKAGESMLKAAQMALFDYAPKTLLLYPQDTEGTVEGAQKAMATALRDKTDIVLGPLLASNVEAVSYQLEMKNIPVIAFSSDHKVADKNTFLLNYLPAKQAQMAAEQMVNAGYTRIATLTPENTYGIEVLSAFTNALKERGLTPVVQSTFNPNSNDHTKALEKLVQLEKAKFELNKQRQELQKEYDLLGEAMDDDRKLLMEELKNQKAQPLIEFDALFVPSSGQTMPLMASQLAYYDIDSSHTLLMGTAQWNTPVIRQNKAEYLKGSQFIAPRQQSNKSFEALYNKAYSQQPHPLAALAYDAVMVVGTLFEENPQKMHNLKDFLVRSEGFSGASGAFKFNNNGTTEHLYDVLEVDAYTFKDLEESSSKMPPKFPTTVDPRDDRSGFKFW